MYMQVVGVLVVILILYYAAMIALDIQKQKAARAAELEKASEVDIDISDEAETFKPVLISRDEPTKLNNEVEAPISEQVSEEATTDEKEDESSQQESSGTSQDSGESGIAPQEKEEEITVDKDKETPEDKADYKRPGYREPVMTDGVFVEELINQVNKVVETGQTDLGLLIYRCESARNAS